LQKSVHRSGDAHLIARHGNPQIGERKLVRIVLNDEDHGVGRAFLDARSGTQPL